MIACPSVALNEMKGVGGNYEGNERMVSCLLDFFNKILSRRIVGRVFMTQTDSANEALSAEAGLLHNYCAINSLSRNRFGRGSRKRVACGSPYYWWGRAGVS